MLSTKETGVLTGRYLATYLGVISAINDGLRGSQPAAGMALASREEANLRYALSLAFDCGEYYQGQLIADTLRDYLERAGRRSERDTLVAWVRKHLPQTGDANEINNAVCAAIRQHAWSLFEQGQAQEALAQVQALLEKLQQSDSSPFQIAITQLYLGRIYYHTGRSDLALAPLQAAITGYEQLGEKQQGNLSASLGDLANAYMGLGRFDEALTASKWALALSREQGSDREIAAGLGQTAAILMDTQRYAEAEVRYREGMAIARQVGDVELETAFLQNMGFLYHQQGRYAEAVRHYQSAIRLFQTIGNRGGEMRTCGLIASAEANQDRLDEAMVWYARARELAVQRQDRRHLAITAQNLGILYQQCAEQADTDPAARDAWLEKAVALMQESLEILLEMQNQPTAAVSYYQLGMLYGMLDDLNAAEQNTRQALAIWEPLNHPHLQKGYDSLMQIARARGDEKAAVEWERKRDAKQAELERLRRGG
uniref:Tetratricopeptide repeat-containing protein n=1 Tax=Candidatus Kentrum sp. FM TaxID=2126340 RepID=A0A450T5J6_9GAMM|nr:MAG: Tetratricopeptide repeat-containing protein [Candidatus Kentron sp. FM]VFJ62051.1 MAG: Tetratricopeptide repeat-containing protein [Candidatus Kentron sp. FM]VFK13374.1 MAG: Tetratricopeptide repeat-containing protein [Candidatus Kentron sp. FM]